MGQMEDMRLFVAVIEAGSITRAAQSLGIAKSAVSRRVSLLEGRYETVLIDRQRGNWEITETGRELFQRATRLLQDMDEITDDFTSTSAVVEGPLSVSVPLEFGVSFLQPALFDFKRKYPQIRLTVNFDERQVDLSRENFDLAIRITNEPEAKLLATRVGSVWHGLFCSRGYLETHPAPKELRNLHDHQLLYFGSAHRATWEFLSTPGKTEIFEFQPYLNSNSGTFLLNAVKQGLGIARLPNFILGDLQHSDDIVQVLPEVKIENWGIFLVHAENRRMNRRMRLFTEAIKTFCARSQKSIQVSDTAF